MHLSTEAGGLPLAALLTPGQAGDVTHAEALLERTRAAGPRRSWPGKVAGDKAYSKPALRSWLGERGAEPVIPTRKDEDGLGRREPGFDKEAYRKRNAIERCVGRLKECRRVGTRYEKLAVNFMAMVTLAMICVYLRLEL